MGGKPKTTTNKTKVTINKSTCIKCNKECLEKPETFEEQSIDCDCCQQWYHVTCAEMSEGKHDAISNFKLKWYCFHCDMGAASLYEMCVSLRSQQMELKNEVSGLARRIEKCEVSDAATVNRVSVCEQNTTSLTIKVNNLKDSVLNEVKAHLSLENTENNPLQTIKRDIITEVKAELGSTSKVPEQTSPWKTVNGPTPQFKDILRQEVREQKELEAIRENLVISGIAESDSISDLDKVHKLLKDEMDIEPQIESIERCGKLRQDQEKPRLLKIRIVNTDTRKKILQKAKNLRDSDCEHIRNSVWIRPDQTRKQQEESKNLRDELRARRLQDPTKTLKIIKGVIQEVNQD